jgi:hypothetical protein
VIVYSLWKIVGTLRSSELAGMSESLGPRGDETIRDIAGIVRPLTVGLYACVAFGAALGTGLMALYYHRREAMLRTFLGGTPDWIVRVIRAGA